MYSKLGQKLHKIRIRILTDRRLQIALYSISFLIILILVSTLVLTSINQQRSLVRYNLKACYNRNAADDFQDPDYSSDIIYATKSNYAVVFYSFQQLCYRRMDFDYEQKGNVINLYLETENLNQECLCESEFSAEIGPLDSMEYTINIIKKAAGMQYLVSSQNITIQ